MKSDLKMPTAGYRSRSAGSMDNQGAFGGYWSSSPSNLRGYYMNLSTDIAPSSISGRASGFSVRCFKN